jgi:branched-chain amino acid transport system ATP-binding protein
MSDRRPNILEISHVSCGYGRVGVLRDVSLEVGEGEVVTLIGANGAGKSTLLACAAGIIAPWSGSITLRGEEVGGLAAEKLVPRGLSLVPEGRRLFGDLSVRENLELGTYGARGDRRQQLEEGLELVHELFPVLSDRSSQPAATLSGGEQQMLAIARGLMSRPDVLLLDEPSLGLAPKIISEIFGVLDTLRSRGLTLLLIEQDASLALKHADRGYVLRTGEIVLSGTSEELLANDDVRLIYLGAWHDVNQDEVTAERHNEAIHDEPRDSRDRALGSDSADRSADHTADDS